MIARKVGKGVPEYRDAAEQYRDAKQSDVFVLSGVEDLVPVEVAPGGRFEDRVSAPGYVIHRFRPRIEGLFSRIERWTKVGDPADVHWRSISKDNLLTLYGKDSNSRIGTRTLYSLPVSRRAPKRFTKAANSRRAPKTTSTFGLPFVRSASEIKEFRRGSSMSR